MTLRTLAVLLVLAACSSAGRPTASDTPPVQECTFTNPVAPGADPWVVRHEGQYYMVQSRSNGIWVSRSARLTDVPTASPVRVWAAPDTGWNRGNVWAPELHVIDGRWYIYYAAGPPGSPFLRQRAGVLQSAGTDAQGPYIDRGMLYTGDDVATGANNRWAIDLTVERINGQLYAVWSGWETDATTDRTPQHLYVARMSNPWTIATNRVRLSSPTASWERGTELDLQEGPEFLLHAGQVFVIYSTRESWLPAYRLGQLRLASATADPMNPANWTKSGPVFTGTQDVYGVGHASFTTAPDTTEWWIVYHSKVSTTPGWNRDVRMQRFDWNPDGSPYFGNPVSPGQRLRVPTGQSCP